MSDNDTFKAFVTLDFKELLQKHLQSEWDSLCGGCLCTMRESCSWCDHDAGERRNERKKEIAQLASACNITIYRNQGWLANGEPVDFSYLLED
jgi:hypothetical protein